MTSTSPKRSRYVLVSDSGTVDRGTSHAEDAAKETNARGTTDAEERFCDISHEYNTTDDEDIGDATENQDGQESLPAQSYTFSSAKLPSQNSNRAPFETTLLSFGPPPEHLALLDQLAQRALSDHQQRLNNIPNLAEPLARAQAALRNPVSQPTHTVRISKTGNRPIHGEQPSHHLRIAKEHRPGRIHVVRKKHNPADEQKDSSSPDQTHGKAEPPANERVLPTINIGTKAANVGGPTGPCKCSTNTEGQKKILASISAQSSTGQVVKVTVAEVPYKTEQGDEKDEVTISISFDS